MGEPAFYCGACHLSVPVTIANCPSCGQPHKTAEPTPADPGPDAEAVQRLAAPGYFKGSDAERAELAREVARAYLALQAELAAAQAQRDAAVAAERAMRERLTMGIDSWQKMTGGFSGGAVTPQGVADLLTRIRDGGSPT